MSFANSSVDALTAAPLLCLPLFEVIAIAMKATSCGPVLFRRTRVGLGSPVFRLSKFRLVGKGAEQKDFCRAVAKDHDCIASVGHSAFCPERLSAIGETARAHDLPNLPRETGTVRFDAVFQSIVADVV